jgi:hypothetical protein
MLSSAQHFTEYTMLAVASRKSLGVVRQSASSPQRSKQRAAGRHEQSRKRKKEKGKERQDEINKPSHDVLLLVHLGK